MINVSAYSKSKKLQDSSFVQLKNPDTNELEFTKKEHKDPQTGKIELFNDKAIGFEIYSIHSTEFKRALRSTAHLGLTKDEQKSQKEILGWIEGGTSASDENQDLLDSYEDKVTKRMQRVFAMVTVKLHHIELPKDFAEEAEIKVTKSGEVVESVDNIYKLYVALPDLSAQIGNAISDKQNFTNA